MYPLSLSLLGFNCFVDEAWPATDVVVTRDLPYGSNFNNVTGEQQMLLLDIYEPPASDNRTLRVAQHRAVTLARPAKCGLDDDLRGAPRKTTVVRLADDVLPRGLIPYNRRLPSCDEPAVGPAAANDGAVPLGLSVRGDAHARPWYRPLLVRDRRAGQAC